MTKVIMKMTKVIMKMMVTVLMMIKMMMIQWSGSLLLGYSGWWSVEGSLITPLGGLMLLYLYSATFCISTISYLYLSHHTPQGINVAVFVFHYFLYLCYFLFLFVSSHPFPMLLYLYSTTFCISTISYLYLSHYRSQYFHCIELK